MGKSSSMSTHDTRSCHLKRSDTTTPTLGLRDVGERTEESSEKSPEFKRGRGSRYILKGGRGKPIRGRCRGPGTGRERRTEKSDQYLITKTFSE